MKVKKIVSFTQMKNGTKEDYNLLNKYETEYAKGTASNILHAMVNLDKGLSGYQVSRLGHSLQSATRAWFDGADIDWVVSALLHDIGDMFAPYNHDEYAATIIKPFVREQCRWVVEKHGDFQLIYYAHHIDDSNLRKRDRHKGNQFFDDCVLFCERWDQASFDPNYKNLSIDFFAPMVHQVFARKPYSKFFVNAKPSPLVNREIAIKRQG